MQVHVSLVQRFAVCYSSSDIFLPYDPHEEHMCRHSILYWSGDWSSNCLLYTCDSGSQCLRTAQSSELWGGVQLLDQQASVRHNNDNMPNKYQVLKSYKSPSKSQYRIGPTRNTGHLTHTFGYILHVHQSSQSKEECLAENLKLDLTK